MAPGERICASSTTRPVSAGKCSAAKALAPESRRRIKSARRRMMLLEFYGRRLVCTFGGGEGLLWRRTVNMRPEDAGEGSHPDIILLNGYNIVPAGNSNAV